MNLNGHIVSEKNAEKSAGHSCHLFEIIEYKGTNTSHLKKKLLNHSIEYRHTLKVSMIHRKIHIIFEAIKSISFLFLKTSIFSNHVLMTCHIKYIKKPK